MDIKALENATQTKFVTARAYSSIHDTVENSAKQAAKFPKSNFTDVVPAQLNKDEYKTLVLQAGTVDITNLNTKDNPSEYVEYFKQEAVMSAKNMFQVAVDALSSSPNLEKIILMKQIPRYDPSHVDPLALKPALSQLYNNTLTNEWMTSQYKDRILIGNHSIECTGAIKEARYRETKTGRFDGIHLYGSSGRKAYTLSMLRILKESKITSSDFEYHQSCEQYRYQAGQKTYRQQNKNQQTGNRRNNRNVNNQKSVFSLPTQNRFRSLPEGNQGNL